VHDNFTTVSPAFDIEPMRASGSLPDASSRPANRSVASGRQIAAAWRTARRMQSKIPIGNLSSRDENGELATD